jgi:hypothetical protein
MAHTRKEAEELYLQKVYELFTHYEGNIDDILVKSFNNFVKKGYLIIPEREIVYDSNRSSSAFFDDKYKDAIVSLIQDKYSEWQVEMKEVRSYNNIPSLEFTFKYDVKEKSFIPLLNDLGERFAQMTVEEEQSGYSQDDIPF